MALPTLKMSEGEHRIFWTLVLLGIGFAVGFYFGKSEGVELERTRRGDFDRVQTIKH